MHRSSSRSSFLQASVFLGVLAFLCAGAASGQGSAYSHGPTPGTEAWADVPAAEHTAVVQIPPKLLESMSTPQLLDTVLDYPLFPLMFADDDTQAAFEHLSGAFNGLRELQSRHDAGPALLSAYRSSNASRVGEGWSLLEQGQFAFRLYYLEMLLAQDWALRAMEHDELRELLAEARAKRDQKLERSDVHGALGLERTALVAARGLALADPSFAGALWVDPPLASFAARADYASPRTLDFVFDRLDEYLGYDADWDPKAFGLVEPLLFKDYNSTVTTPRGTAVPVIVRTYELTASQIASTNHAADTQYPLATRETDASRKYNCHSYAWYSTSTSNNRWMNTPGDDTYWQDGSYVAVQNIVAGTRVSYTGDHSAIAISSTEYRSKWGQWPRMRHAPNDVPPGYGTVRQGYMRPNFRVSLSGPTDRNPGQSGTWTASVSSGVAPYTFSWFKSTSDGIVDLSSTCSSTSTVCSSTTSDTQSFNIVVDVRDASGRFASDYVYVDVDGPPDGPGLPF